MSLYYDEDGIQVYNGDCLDVMRGMADNSIDTIITDPPYELGFMGKKWDNSGIAFLVDLWKEALRIAKPGATLLCFGGTRTWHRLACAIEDAGWVIKDTLMWLYGSGFPKSLNIGKEVDKRLGNEREVVGKEEIDIGIQSGSMHAGRGSKVIIRDITKGNTEWEGYGTALKPAFEPIIMAMKPNEGGYVDNALKWGVAGLNIDGGRIGTEKTKTTIKDLSQAYGNKFGKANIKYPTLGYKENTPGRFPANLILDEEAAQTLDEQSGVIASRFFYVAKASRGERNMGCNELPKKAMTDINKIGGEKSSFKTGQGKDRDVYMHNNHPTVKPIKLMEYLVELTSMQNSNQIYLDPFAGSGTTLLACKRLNKKAIGIERELEYCDIAVNRINKIQNNLF